MKKKIIGIITIILLSSMLFILTGCASNNDINNENTTTDNQSNLIDTNQAEDNNANSKIVGKWETIGTNNNVFSLGTLYGSAFSNANELTFKEDSTYVLGIGVTYWQEGNYKVDGDVIKLTNTEMKGDNPDGKVAEEFIIKDQNGKMQIVLQEKQEPNVIVDVIFKKSDEISDNEGNNSSNETTTNRISAGDFYLEYGNYINTYYSNDDFMGGTYTLNEDGTFYCTNSQGTATGTYTVSQETYQNSAETFTDWLISFKSSNTELMNANMDWIIDGNNQFSGVQDGGTFKYMGK